MRLTRGRWECKDRVVHHRVTETQRDPRFYSRKTGHGFARMVTDWRESSSECKGLRTFCSAWTAGCGCPHVGYVATGRGQECPRYTGLSSCQGLKPRPFTNPIQFLVRAKKQGPSTSLGMTMLSF